MRTQQNFTCLPAYNGSDALQKGAFLLYNSSMDSTNAWTVLLLLCFFALIRTTDSHVFSHDDARSLNGPVAQSFVDRLFEEYGANKSMNLKQFSALLKELKVGSMYTTGQKSSSETAKGNVATNGADKV